MLTRQAVKLEIFNKNAIKFQTKFFLKQEQSLLTCSIPVKSGRPLDRIHITVVGVQNRVDGPPPVEAERRRHNWELGVKPTVEIVIQGGDGRDARGISNCGP